MKLRSLLFGLLLVITAEVAAQAQPVPRPVGSRFADVGISVKDYGAKGDATADDGAAIAAAIAAVPAGGRLILPAPAFCYKITADIDIAKALEVVGRNSEICQTTANTGGLNVTASNVHIDGLWLSGPATAAFQANGTAIKVAGTFTAGLAPTNITNVSVTNTRIEHWGAYGILAQHVSGLYLSGNKITDVGYTGVGVLSGLNCRIAGNLIDTVGPGTSSNAYGIYLSRLTTDSGELTSQPRTSDCTVANNVIKNIPIWDGINTHGGQRIAITGNTIYKTFIGIDVGSSLNSSNADTYAPLDVTVSGNTMDSGVTDGSAYFGIDFHGVLGGAKATGTIMANTVTNYGAQSNTDNGSGIYLLATSGVSVSGNTIINPAWMGICLYAENVGFVASGNGIVDAWSNSGAVAKAVAIDVKLTNNKGSIGGNTFTTNGKSATYVLTRGIDVNNDASNAIQLGPNYSAAGTYISDPGNLTSAIFTSFPTVSVNNGTVSGNNLISVSKNQNDFTAIKVSNTDTTNSNSRSSVNLIGGTVNANVSAIAGLGMLIGPNTANKIEFITNGTGAWWMSSDGSFTVGSTEKSLTGAGALWAGASSLSTLSVNGGTADANNIVSVAKNQNDFTAIKVSNSDTTNSNSRAQYSLTSGSINGMFSAANTIGLFFGANSADKIRFITGGTTDWWMSTDGSFTVGTTEKSSTGAGPLWAGAATLVSTTSPKFVASGSAPTTGGTCPVTSQVGGNAAGTFTMNGVCSGGTVTLTFATAAPNGWACHASDRTTPSNTLSQTASSTTVATLTGTTGASDVVSFQCMAY